MTYLCQEGVGAIGLAYSIGPFFGSMLYQYTGRDPLTFWGCVSIFAVFAAFQFRRMNQAEALQA